MSNDRANTVMAPLCPKTFLIPMVLFIIARRQRMHSCCTFSCLGSLKKIIIIVIFLTAEKFSYMLISARKYYNLTLNSIHSKPLTKAQALLTQILEPK